MKKLELLRCFFRFAHDNNFVTDNPARKIKNPKVTARPTLPFERNEMTRILSAVDKYQGSSLVRLKLRALILILRYSGLRIRDAVTLSRDRISDEKLFLYTSKTGTPVYCPLPALCIRALEMLPNKSQFHFWTGTGKVQTATGDWQGKLKQLFELAEVVNGHAHRFRDTFATELLLQGVPMERVSVLLGHSSIRITERHYSPWVRSRQEQLEADVRRTWAADVIAQSETKGTRREGLG